MAPIRQASYQSRAIGGPAGNLVSVGPGFFIRGYAVDNLSGSWLLEPSSGQYIKPYTVGFAINLRPAASSLSIVYAAIGPGNQASDNTKGSPFALTVYDGPIINAPGESFLNPNGTPVSSVSTITPTAQTFIASGSFTVPAGISSGLLAVFAVGGGGKGGTGSGLAGGGGGGAGSIVTQVIAITPGMPLTITIGASGGSSSVVGPAVNIAAIAGGAGGTPSGPTGGTVGGSGGGGSGAVATGSGGGGGGAGSIGITASNGLGGSGGAGTTGFAGGAGGSVGIGNGGSGGTAVNGYGGGGGGGGGSGGGSGGAGGSGAGGAGGVGAVGGAGQNNTGSGGGGGGSGGALFAGGLGGNGIVILTYTVG